MSTATRSRGIARVELYLTLLDLPFERIHVDLLTRAQKQPAFLDKNASGQVPVIEDGDVTLADSTAIMVYLGERYDEDGRFWPRTPEGKAAVQRCLSVASGLLAFGPAAARRARSFAPSWTTKAPSRRSVNCSPRSRRS